MQVKEGHPHPPASPRPRASPFHSQPLGGVGRRGSGSMRMLAEVDAVAAAWKLLGAEEKALVCKSPLPTRSLTGGDSWWSDLGASADDLVV